MEKRVVTLEELEAEREAKEGSERELWHRIVAIQNLMRPEKRGGPKRKASRPSSLSEYGAGDSRNRAIDFVKQVYEKVEME